MEEETLLHRGLSRCRGHFTKDLTIRRSLVYGSFAAWAQNQSYTQAAVNVFLKSADYWLVAQAHALQFTVVTHEKPEPESKKKVKIPDACNVLGVRYAQPWEMLRSEGAKFIF